MSKLIFKTTIFSATILLLIALVFNACTKNEVYYPNDKSNNSVQSRAEIGTFFSLKPCERDGVCGAMCENGPTDDCWDFRPCTTGAESVMNNHYTEDELEELIKNHP